MALVAVVLLATNAQAAVYSTRHDGGADAELRESAPDQARGTGTEIASRIASNRNSVIYLKFNVADISPAELLGDIAVRTTYRNANQLTAGRIEDTVGGGANTGFDYFVMDPTIAGADWDEATITPNNAPAYNSDGDLSTKPTGYTFFPTTGLTYLGQQLFDSGEIYGGALLVGDQFEFNNAPGSALHAAIVAAQATDHKTVTVVMGIAHDATNPNTNWIGFNYLMNPKEMNPLNADSDSPWGGDIMSDLFAPALVTPEPATLVLLGLGGLVLRRKR